MTDFVRMIVESPSVTSELLHRMLTITASYDSNTGLLVLNTSSTTQTSKALLLEYNATHVNTVHSCNNAENITEAGPDLDKIHFSAENELSCKNTCI